MPSTSRRKRKKQNMAPAKTLDVRWIRRYRGFCLAGSVILTIQVFLAYIFFTIYAEDPKLVKDLLQEKKFYFEALEDPNGVESSRRFKDNYLSLDDEEDDSPANSNAVERRVKVPPDKMENKVSNKVTGGSKIVDTNTRLVLNKTSILRLEELDFIPLCEITGKEAVSAIHRAKTQHCKQLLANITCLNLKEELYPSWLPHSCPNKGHEAGKLLGCYKDEKAFRLLSGYYTNLKSNNSPQNCINLCLQSGFPFAGVQYRNECFCGNDEPISTARLPDSSCNMKCPANPKEACGGYYTINIYHTGITKFSPQPPAEVDTSLGIKGNVRIAFLLTLNGRAVRQVKRLLKTLFHRDHFFYIHIDSRQDYMFRELLSLEMRFSNIRLSRRRHSTIWGGASLLTMLLESMAELIQADWDWDFVINLSESDFPVKSNKDLVEFLTVNKERNFVKSHGREVQRFIQKQGLDKTFVECEAHMWRAGDRNLPWGIAMDGGSDWIALSRPFVTYVTSERKDQLLTGLLTVFKYTLLPAESFFHTVLRNSIFCDTYVDNNLHVTNWKRRLGCKCQYKHVVDWCGCSPNNFKTEDWTRLQGTEPRPLYFARKFEPIINQAIILQLEEWLSGSYPSNVTNLNSYWQSVYHYQDLIPAFDDTLLTFATSLTRVSVKLMTNFAIDCSIIANRVFELTSYMNNDIYKGTLIRFEAHDKSSQSNIELETWFRPQNNFTIFHQKGPAQRLRSLTVSSDYDQKEQTSRNLQRSLSVFSEPSAVFYFIGGIDSYNLTLLWIDPVGELADISEVSIDENSLVNGIKASIKTPLLPGVWLLRMVYDGVVIAQTDFVVFPLQFFSGIPITQQQAEILHGGSRQPYKVAKDAYSHLLEPPDPVLERKSLANIRRSGKDLHQWIDSLTSRFYSVMETCAVSSKETNLCRSIHLEPCHTTSWSSYAPDPKSTISTINKFTGLLDRW
uniref:protein xylosyltransferase n=1 Tax=Clastoptera arizonana TaxID=38151 RepID=A0A1B6CJW1_9HEMI